MKKLVSAILALVMIITVMPITVFAQESDSKNDNSVFMNDYDGITITYDESTKTLKVAKKENTAYSPTLGHLYHTETKDFNFGNPMYWSPKEVMDAKTLIIEDGINAIGDYTFINFIELEKVVIPKKLNTIGRATFLNCKRLKEIEGGESITEIGEGAFFNCTSLKKVSFPSLTRFDETPVKAFSAPDEYNEDWWGLDDEYHLGAFMHCKSLESVNIPKVTNLVDRTFYDCPKLKTINSDNKLNKVYHIGASAFYNCKSLKSIALPEIGELKSGNMTVKTAERKGTFENCTSLKTVTIPKITTIGENTFFNCSSLKTINSNNNLKNVTYLGAGAFTKCSSLEKISLPKVKNLYMTKWTENNIMDFPQLVKKCSESFRTERENDCDAETYYYNFNTKYYIDYYGEKTYGTFEGCTKLKSISVPNVTTVGARAFYQCQSLKSISMPKAKSLGASAFYNCKSLTKVNLPNISTLPNKKWTNFKTKKSYYRGVFENCSKLKKLTILSIDTIGIYSFKNCKSLEKIDLCCNLKSIGNNAFQNCTSLKSITIPKRVKTIGSSAFYNAKKLKSITIKSSKLKSVGKSAFGKIKSNATFTVPKKQLKKYKKLIKPTAPKKVKYRTL
jgi:hypothetical protein